MEKLAIISTHPIQYNAPLFKLLAERKKLDIKVFYTWSQSQDGTKYDPGFGKNIEWDIPLLDGYNFTFVENVASDPGSHHFKGIQNPTLLTEITTWRAEAVLIYGWNFKSHLNALRFFKNKLPVLFRGDSTLLDETVGIKRIMRRIFLRYVFSLVDTALYAGEANKQYFLAHGLLDNQLKFMPHAIDNDRYAGSETNKIAGRLIREKLGIPKEAFVFLFAGKLERKKQPHFLAEVFSQINNENAYLLIVGNGNLEVDLKSSYSKNLQIKFLDFVNQTDMPALYACCDVFVLPSKGPGETWGLSVNEAMAAGKAIIVSDACGCGYNLIKDGFNGFIFQKDNPEMLKKNLLYFISNPANSIGMGDHSFNIIQEYCYEADCIAIENILLKNELI